MTKEFFDIEKLPQIIDPQDESNKNNVKSELDQEIGKKNRNNIDIFKEEEFIKMMKFLDPLVYFAKNRKKSLKFQESHNIAYKNLLLFSSGEH